MAMLHACDWHHYNECVQQDHASVDNYHTVAAVACGRCSGLVGYTGHNEDLQLVMRNTDWLMNMTTVVADTFQCLQVASTKTHTCILINTSYQIIKCNIKTLKSSPSCMIH